MGPRFLDRRARAKGVIALCFTLGAADLAVIDLRLAPAAIAQAEASEKAEPARAPLPLVVSSAAITQAAVALALPTPAPSSSPSPSPSTTREEYTVLFATDNARLDKAALAALDHIAPGGVVEVSVEGYADARGTTTYNQALSERRAAAIAEALAARGVVAQRVRGLGAVRPLGSADPDALRRERRVEVHIARRIP